MKKNKFVYFIRKCHMSNIIGSLEKPCVLKIQVSTNYKISQLATCIKPINYT